MGFASLEIKNFCFNERNKMLKNKEKHNKLEYKMASNSQLSKCHLRLYCTKPSKFTLPSAVSIL